MNNQIFFFFYNLAHQSAFLDKVIIFFADTFPYIVILLAVIYLFFYKKNWKDFFIIFISSGLAWFISYILKILIHTPRPFDVFPKVVSLFSETGYAFPSGHATFFMALAFSIFFNHKKVGYIFIFFALLIGLARIIAGVHFPIDILGGYIVGFVIAFFLKKV
ncbi:MAG: phosphatase PAP2 family protein [Candidatus Nomurabacteria bacterium]|nr:phosphatase PAP2 family protein [Candidatus Nomurabacteria bacterium]